MTKVDSYGGYDFYLQSSNVSALYNIVPSGSPVPGGGV